MYGYMGVLHGRVKIALKTRVIPSHLCVEIGIGDFRFRSCPEITLDWGTGEITSARDRHVMAVEIR